MSESGLTPEQIESLAANLQQRMGQLVVQYETDLALLKAQFEQIQMELKRYQDAEKAQKAPRDTGTESRGPN